MVFPNASRLISRYYGERTKPFHTRVAYRAIVLASGKRMARAGQEEAEYVLPYRYPGAFIVSLAMEINSAEFAQYPVTVAAVLSGATARSLAHLFFLLTGGFERAARAREPGTRIPFGPGNTVPAREENRSTRGDKGNSSRWDTSKRTHGLRCCRHRTIPQREQQKPTGQAKGRARMWGGW